MQQKVTRPDTRKSSRGRLGRSSKDCLEFKKYDGRTDGQRDGRTMRWMDGRTDGRMDRWTEEWMEGQMDGCLEIPPCALQDIAPLGPLPKNQARYTATLVAFGWAGAVLE